MTTLLATSCRPCDELSRLEIIHGPQRDRERIKALGGYIAHDHLHCNSCGCLIGPGHWETDMRNGFCEPCAKYHNGAELCAHCDVAVRERTKVRGQRARGEAPIGGGYFGKAAPSG